jgi:hypothetical protein
MEIERVMNDKSLVDENVVKALQQAGTVSKEALRIKKEMDDFYQQNKEWLIVEQSQIDARDEDLTGKDEKVQAQIAAARRRFQDYKIQLQTEIGRLIRKNSLGVRK